MSGSHAAITFQAMVERYERCGWDVRTIDHTTLRATVRATACDHGEHHIELMLKVPERVPACRKLWVDAHGQVQQTDVPC